VVNWKIISRSMENHAGKEFGNINIINKIVNVEEWAKGFYSPNPQLIIRNN